MLWNLCTIIAVALLLHVDRGLSAKENESVLPPVTETEDAEETRTGKSVHFGSGPPVVDSTQERVSYQGVYDAYDPSQAYETFAFQSPPFGGGQGQGLNKKKKQGFKNQQKHVGGGGGGGGGGGYFPDAAEYYPDYDNADDLPPALEKIGNFFKGIDLRSDILKPTVSGIVLSGVFLGTTFFLLPLIGGKLTLEAKDITVGAKESSREGKGLNDIFSDRFKGFSNIFKSLDPTTPLKWLYLERDSCQRRMVCEFQSRIAKFPILAKLSRSFFEWWGRYTDAVSAGERHDVCYRSFTCQYGLKGLWNRVQKIFGYRRLDG
ncbi:unnamed protein product [Cyprideis torosa]|uniref:Uncharacterized protein n=1 Tax=Cyprideis torosa TaxID=163714 RepID=A0A7R8WJS3_9CRUS|nr:unnamed protein product [Cyprideis torosa]CAG0899496.1 unnamed protein product [Cyprideis torosa]